MASRRAVVIDRDSTVLVRLATELSRAGYSVETLASTLGLTPDLLSLSAPDLVVLDAGLPGLEPAALLVLARSLRSRSTLRLVLTAEAAGQLGDLAHAVVLRDQLLIHGAASFGVSGQAVEVDVRAILDEVLGGRPVDKAQALDVRIDLFSKSNFWVGVDNKLAGVFVATALLLPVGQKVTVRVDLNGRTTFELLGEVGWQRPHQSFGGKVATGIGVRVSELTEEQRQTFERFLEAREPIAHAA